MMHKKMLRCVCLAAVLSVMCSGCSVFPEEEVYPTAPVLQSYEEVTYKQTPVWRGDLSLIENVSCKYISAQEETLRFMRGEEYIDGVYVEPGQQVKAGDLLAALEENGLSEQIIEQEYKIKKIRLQLEHAAQNWEMALIQLDAWDDQESQDYAEAKGVINRDYELEKQSLEDSLYIEEMRLSRMEEERESRNLYASIDGTIMFAREISAGQKSVAGEVIVTLADMTNNVFAVTGDQADYFALGEQVSIELYEDVLPAVVVDGAEVGMPSNGEGGEKVTYLKLVTPDPTLKNGIKGSIFVTLDSKTDVLYVDKHAVQTANGKQFVYVLNEDGLRVMQDVTVGLTNNDYCEIISGLEDGDSVILD